MRALVQRPWLRSALVVVLFAWMALGWMACGCGLTLAVEDDHVALGHRRRRKCRGDALHATGYATSSSSGGVRLDAADAQADLAVGPTLTRLADPSGHADAVPTQAVAML